MRFHFTLKFDSLDLLNKIFQCVSKLWESQRLVFWCSSSGITLYPESISPLSPAFCQITFSSPSSTPMPAIETKTLGDGTSLYEQFFKTYTISSERSENLVIFSTLPGDDLVKTIKQMCSLKTDAESVFKLIQENVNGYIRKYLLCEIRGDTAIFTKKIEVETYFDSSHFPPSMIPKQATVYLTKDLCGNYIYPMCSAAKKLKEEAFTLSLDKREQNKEGECIYQFGICSETFVMDSRRGIAGQLEEGVQMESLSVKLPIRVFTAIFSIMALPGTGFLKFRNKEALELEYLPVRFPGVKAIFDSQETDID